MNSPKINLLNDGASFQAQAVMCYLSMQSGLEASLNDLTSEYEAVFSWGRYENCREQGYCISLDNEVSTLNIAFFEHRNSDSIHAIKFYGRFLNTPTIDDALLKHESYSNDKYATDHNVPFGQPYEMSEWIMEQFLSHWEQNNA